MLRKGHILAIVIASLSLVTILSIEAQQDLTIPQWVKNNALWWGQGQITDADFVSAIQFLIDKNVLQMTPKEDTSGWKIGYEKLEAENQQLESKISQLEAENSRLQIENQRLEEENAALYDLNTYSDSSSDSFSNQYTEPEPSPEDYCKGSAGCFVGYVTKVVDGDTIEVDGQSIRFALVNTPEYGDYGYSEARNYIDSICPVGSLVLVDEDDGQTQGSYGRMIGIIYCQDVPVTLNEAILEVGLGEIDTRFCSSSEFGYDSWAQYYGCPYTQQEYSEPKTQPSKTETQPTQPSCDPHYPDVCIPPYPPDLDCGEIPYRDFIVLQPDPHWFDGDKDGIGCES